MSTKDLALRNSIIEYINLNTAAVRAGGIVDFADGIISLIERMRHDIANFTFFKKLKDGGTELRTAYGTLDNDIISAYHGEPKGTGRDRDEFNGTITYFDTERKAWRSFNVTRFVQYNQAWDFEDAV